MESIKRQTRAAYGWLVISQVCGRRLSLLPIGCTPALSVTWTAPLQLRYAACGAIQVLYVFALAQRGAAVGDSRSVAVPSRRVLVQHGFFADGFPASLLLDADAATVRHRRRVQPLSARPHRCARDAHLSAYQPVLLRTEVWRPGIHREVGRMPRTASRCWHGQLLRAVRRHTESQEIHSLSQKIQISGSDLSFLSIYLFIIHSAHKLIGGTTPKFLGGPNLCLRATTLWLGINRNHRVMCVKFNKEWKTVLHIEIWCRQKFYRLVAYHIIHNRRLLQRIFAFWLILQGYNERT